MTVAWVVFLFNIAAAITNLALWISICATRRRAAFELKWVMNARRETTQLLEDAAAARRVAKFDRNTWKFARMSSDAGNDLQQKENRK